MKNTHSPYPHKRPYLTSGMSLGMGEPMADRAWAEARVSEALEEHAVGDQTAEVMRNLLADDLQQHLTARDLARLADRVLGTLAEHHPDGEPHAAQEDHA